SLLLVWGAGVAAQSVQPQLMQASKPAIAVPSTGASVTPVAMIAPPGTTLYIAKRGDSIPLVARHYLSQTSYLTSTELAQAIRKANADTHSTFLKPDLPKFVRFLHSKNMHAIARIAIFRDERLVTTHPELAVKSRRTGQAWRENGKLVWTDPSQPKVQEYDIALARRAAEAGTDEIQFDYVRFPAEG